VGFKIVQNVLGGAFEQRPGGSEVLAVVKNLQQRVRQLLVATIGIDEDVTAAVERYRRRHRLRKLRMEPQYLALEFLKSDREHFRPFKQRLVAMRDGGKIEVGMTPLQNLEARAFRGFVLKLRVGLRQIRRLA